MECPSCTFQNTPGTRNCVRCQSLLDFSAVRVEPPRARGGTLIRGVRGAAATARFRLRDAGLSTAVPRRLRLPGLTLRERLEAISQVRIRGVTVAALLASIVPGMGQWIMGSRRRGITILFVWCLLMLFYIANYGSGRGFFVGTMAVSLHCGSVVALLSTTLIEASLRFRAAVGLLVYLVLLVLVYGPMYFGSGLLIGVLPAQNLRVGAEISEGDLVLHTGPWLKPLLNRGDLVAYSVRAAREGNVLMHEGVLIDRILGEPGDLVELRDGKFFLNGEAAPDALQPLGSGFRNIGDLSITAGPDEYILIPSTLSNQGRAASGALRALWERTCRVSRADVLGRVFWRVGSGLDFGPIRDHHR